VITPAEAVDAINERFGRHAGYRALHAKGVLCKGTFTATTEGSGLTKAAHMQGDPVPALVRFSNGSGNPTSPDYEPDVRGMAAKLQLDDGRHTDIVCQTIPRFPVRTPDAFIEFVHAMKPGVSLAWKMPLFLAKHPEALPNIAGAPKALRPPVSFATRRYYAIHAFRWIDDQETIRHVRYRWVPDAGEQTLSAREAKGRGRDYLFEELAARLSSGPVRFGLELQISRDGDPVDDPTAPWRDDRETIRGATLDVTGLETGRETGDDVLVFDPTNVIDGIELTDDPVLRFRAPAYSESVERRIASRA
jgi:catalase